MGKRTGMILGFVLAAAVFWINDRYFFESIWVPSSSMRPTLLPNERFFLNRWNGSKNLGRFDIVVIRHPQYSQRIVKRIVGLPGECVQLRDGWKVSIQGQDPWQYETEDGSSGTGVWDEKTKAASVAHRIQTVKDARYDFRTQYGLKPLCLDADEFYVLGDNRLASEDGRVFGPVKKAWIEGRLVWRWYSFARTSDDGSKGIRWSRIARRVY